MFMQNNFLTLNFSKVFFLILAVLISGSSIARISAAEDNGRPLDELEEVLVTAEFSNRALSESTGGSLSSSLIQILLQISTWKIF